MPFSFILYAEEVSEYLIKHTDVPLAEEIPPHHSVIITTTTKIFIPPADKHPLLLSGKGETAEKELAGFFQSGIRPVLGSELLEENKIKGIDPETIDLLQNMTDFVLVEADGSRGFSLKGHLEHEPVIPSATSVLVVVGGADVIGKPLLPQYVHRPGVVAERTGREPGSIINVEMIATLISHPEGPLRCTPPGARVVTFINKVDRLADPGEAYCWASCFWVRESERSIIKAIPCLAAASWLSYDCFQLHTRNFAVMAPNFDLTIKKERLDNEKTVFHHYTCFSLYAYNTVCQNVQ